MRLRKIGLMKLLKNLHMMKSKRLSRMAYKFFNKKTGSQATSKMVANVNKVLESHKPVIKNSK